MPRLTPLAAALLALGSTSIVHGQEMAQAASTAASAPAQSLDPVSIEGKRDARYVASPTLGKLPAEARDTPQSIVVVDKALMQAQGAVSLADALRNVPGITLGAAEGGQIGNNINLNGFSARTDVYLDGFRDRGQYFRDTFALDAVEVLMGPSSMLFGRGSTGGVINQVTKKATLRPITEVTGAVTTNGLVRSTFDVDRQTAETSAFRLAGMAQEGAPTTRRKMDVKDAGLAPSFRYGINTPTEITLSALLQHNDDRADYGVSPLDGRPVDVARNTVFGFSDDRTKQDVVAVDASLKQRLTATTTLRSQIALNHVTTDARETAPQTLGVVCPGPAPQCNTTPAPAVGFLPLSPANVSALPLSELVARLQSHDRVIHDKSLSNQTEITTSVDTGSFRHNLLLGGEVGHDSYGNQGSYRSGACNGVALGGTSGYVACVPVVDPPYGDSPSTATTHPGNAASGTANELAAYVNDTIDLGPRFKLVAGLRWDRYQAEIGNSMNATNTAGSTAFPSLDQTVHYTSVRTGGIWQPTMAQSYYLSYSTSFNPSLEQLVSTTGLTQPLPPEKNKAYEIGGKIDALDGGLSLTGAVFQITQDNARSQNADNTYTADGTVRVDGARAGAVGRLNERWQVFAGATWLDARIVEGIAVGTQGKVPANTAKASATLWSTYAVTHDVEVGGGAIYVSNRYINNTDLIRVPGYVRLDMTAAWKQPRYDIRLNIFNLANKFYYDALIPSDGGRAVPGTGITGMLSFTYRI